MLILHSCNIIKFQSATVAARLAGLLLFRLRGDLRAGEALLDRGLHHGGVNNHGKLLGAFFRSV